MAPDQVEPLLLLLYLSVAPLAIFTLCVMD
jgi:hypothetical protein